jgi:UDP-N-acetylglucosamine--N-acetylmuramyl-(pentapeptide) pyrophosphoryl-undecaprenol N-acetylglucosamine transferase
MAVSGAAATAQGEEVVSGVSSSRLAAGQPVQLLWAGTRAGMEQALVERAGIPFQGISSGQLRITNPVKIVKNLGKMAGGFRQSLALIDRFQPDVCFVTGGYVCGPVAAACSLRKVPILIYLPDMSPGFAIRSLSRLAQRVAVTLPEVAQHFGGEAPAGKAVVTGYPVRQELVDAAEDRPLARRRLAETLQWPQGGDTALPLLLIWGGSSGARVINRATWAGVAQMLSRAAVLHVVGERDWPLHQQWAQANPLPVELADRYHPVPYLHEAMILALAAADLTVARAGASSLGEFPAAKLPAVLAPLASVNQMDNAQALAKRGAAVIIEDEDLEAKLVPTVLDLLAKPPQLQAMSKAMAGLARPHAAEAIATEIVRLAQER